MISNYSEALEFIYSYIPKTKKVKFAGAFGLARSKYFLNLLGNPQNTLRTVHIAGTSGKGSTAYITSFLLKNLGFKTGLILSPHLSDIRERIQINNNYISKKKFVYYLNRIIPSIYRMKKLKYKKPTYFEILTALAFYVYQQEEVDFCIVETGLGGLYDTTNTIVNPDKVAVITRLGFDHTQVLGSSIGKITRHKAGIIGIKNSVICLSQNVEVNRIITLKAKRQNAKLSFIKRGINYNNVTANINKTCFDFSFAKNNLNNLQLRLTGSYQAQNCSLSLAAVFTLANIYKFEVNPFIIRRALRQTYFPARFDVRTIRAKTVIFDGAHNGQKMKALTQNLKALYPSRKFTFLVAFLSSKDYRSMLELIMPLAKKIILTSFTLKQDFMLGSESCMILANILARQNFNNFQIIPDALKAFNTALREKEEILVVTGSIYLLGEIYQN